MGRIKSWVVGSPGLKGDAGLRKFKWMLLTVFVKGKGKMVIVMGMRMVRMVRKVTTCSRLGMIRTSMLRVILIKEQGSRC